MGHATHTEPNLGMGKKTFKVYATGIVLCILLTLIPFWAVSAKMLSTSSTFLVIFSSAIVQFLVQVICFLRLNLKDQEAIMNMLSFLFSIVVLIVIIGGSLWIMWHLNYRMMH